MAQKRCPDTARDVIHHFLEELTGKEFKEFKIRLHDFAVTPGQSKIPRSRLESSEWMDTADAMIQHYGDERAFEITQELLARAPRLDLLEEFETSVQRFFNKKGELRETNVEDHKRKYKEYIKDEFREMKDNDGRIGETVTLEERYTKLLILKHHRERKDKEHEIMSCGERHLQVMEERAADSYSSIQDLFSPEKDGHIPRTVVLQGVAGIGKTMTARKIMFDWASGNLFQDRFEFVFYIHCREYNQLSAQRPLADLILPSIEGGPRLSMSEIEANPERMLFIIDGFDELKITEDLLSDDPDKKNPKDKTIFSLIRERYLKDSYKIITTRPTALDALQKCVKGERLAEILGFSEVERVKYFAKFFGDEIQAARAIRIVKENEILYTMCFVPIVCWIVCTVIKEQMEDKEGSLCHLRTITSVYLLFLFNLLKQQSKDSVQQNITNNLKSLCALAEEGVYQQKILFEESDLIKHSVDIPALKGLFLKNSILKKSTINVSVYSFIHLSVQEFFAALFYILEGKDAAAQTTESQQRGVSRLLKEYTESRQRGVSRLLGEYTESQQRGVSRSLRDYTESQQGGVSRLLREYTELGNNHLMLTVRFLFGLLNTERLDGMKTPFKWKISPEIKPALQAWIAEKLKQEGDTLTSHSMDLFHCLYETQDEEFLELVPAAVKHIRLSSREIKSKTISTECRALAFCFQYSGVESIDLHDRRVRPEDLRALEPLLMKCSRLELFSCKMWDEERSPEPRSLIPRLAAWFFKKKPPDQDMSPLCAALRDPRCRVRKLSLRLCGITGASCAALAAALRSSRSLLDLDLSFNDLLGDAGAYPICDALKRPDTRLQKISLRCCRITDASCAALAGALRSTRSLLELDLSSNALGDAGASLICDALKRPDTLLRKISLHECKITGASRAALAAALRSSRSLLDLDLSRNDLGVAGVTLICDALKRPDTRLQKISLHECKITSASCAALAAALRCSRSLLDLDLSGNPLGDAGATLICDALKHPDTRLQMIDLSECKITGASCSALAAALRYNRSLLELNLRSNDLGDAGASLIRDALKEPDTRLQKIWLRMD